LAATYREELSMSLLFRHPLVWAIGSAVLLIVQGTQLLAAEKGSTLAIVALAATPSAQEKVDQEPDAADSEKETDDSDKDAEKTDDAKDDDAKEKEPKSADPEEEQAEEEKAKDKKPADDSAEEKKEENSADKEVDKSADKKEESKSEEEKKPKPHTVKSKELKIEQTLEGVFVAKEMEEVALRPDAWSRFEIVEAVEHGTEVKKGDVLVRFDDEQIEEKLAEDTIDQRLSELALMQEEEESPRREKLLDLAYQSAKRTHDQLVEDHEYYLKTDRPFAERIAQYRWDSAKEDLASQEEELAQLKKMYEADEITEETEEIVLRRQEFEVQTAKLMFELQSANRDYTLQVSLPRNDIFYTTALEEARIALEQATTAKELGTTRGKYDLEKKRAARTRSVQSNAKLLGDRALMELKSPSDGTVYYGRCVSGQWSEIGSMTAKLVPFSAIPPNTVLMTVVKQRPLYVLTNIAEKELPNFKNGLAATLTPAADDKAELSAKVTKLSGVPGGGKKFEMRLELDKSDLPEWLVAGMSCSVKVTTYDKKEALLVPADMIQTDKGNDKIKYVMLLGDEDEEPVRREVKVGKSKDKQVEILSGLKAGDKIVKEETKKDDEAEE
jgi:HlyD family secretion protein